MDKEKTYIIICRKGLSKNECPLFHQHDIKCVECSFAGYILREKEQVENTESTEDGK